ncbi:MAG: TetR/AcrR family transcriptional regulator [Pseudomonadota bacterium]
MDATNSLYQMKKQPKQSRSKATVDAVLKAATQVLLTQGYDKASTNRIADRAGVSIGSVYEYFPGKEAVFAEVRRREDRRLYLQVMGRPKPRSVRDLIEQHVGLHFEFVRSNLALHTALANDVPQLAVSEGELAYHTDYVPWLAAFLQLHRDEIRMDPGVPRGVEFITRVVRATINDYVLRAPGRLTDPATERLLIDLLERFVLA